MAGELHGLEAREHTAQVEYEERRKREDAFRAGKLPVERLLTHRLGLEELNEGFDRLARGEAVRQVVVF